MQDRAGGSRQERVGSPRQHPDGPLSLVSVNSYSRFKTGKAEAFNDRLTYIRNEVMAVKGGNVSQWHGSHRASDTILQRTKMAAMSIRTTKLAVQDMVAALGLDVNSLSPEDIDQIIRCSMNAKWRMTVLKNTLGDSRKVRRQEATLNPDSIIYAMLQKANGFPDLLALCFAIFAAGHGGLEGKCWGCGPPRLPCEGRALCLSL